MSDRWYLAALLPCRYLGSVRLARLCAAVSSAAQIWKMSAGELYQTGALPLPAAEELSRHIRTHPHLPEQIQEDCQRSGIALLTRTDDLYPTLLREIFDPPMVLYYRGTIVPHARRIGIVGARKFTA